MESISPSPLSGIGKEKQELTTYFQAQKTDLRGLATSPPYVSQARQANCFVCYCMATLFFKRGLPSMGMLLALTSNIHPTPNLCTSPFCMSSLSDKFHSHNRRPHLLPIRLDCIDFSAVQQAKSVSCSCPLQKLESALLQIPLGFH